MVKKKKSAKTKEEEIFQCEPDCPHHEIANRASWVMFGEDYSDDWCNLGSNWAVYVIASGHCPYKKERR